MAWILFFGSAGLILIAWGFWFILRRRTPIDSSRFYPEYPRVGIKMRGKTIHAVRANTVARRTQGLSGCPGMKNDQGMLFKFNIPSRHPMWMKDMRFPLDMIWLRRGRIADISKGVPPPAPDTPAHRIPRVRPRTIADSVLEVNAGVAASLGLKVGDEVEVVLQEDGV